MTAILHHSLPAEMHEPRPLPGIRPVQGEWLRVDEAYGAQMAERERLLGERRDDVLWCPPDAVEAAVELLDLVLDLLPGLGFRHNGTQAECPDGRTVAIDRRDPLATLGRLVQCDFCLLDRPAGGAEHVLRAAILCFPASWTLSEKAGRPLLRIHKPVKDYDATLARRVQRLFDGVQAGRPIWRFNNLRYDDPALFQPRREDDPRADFGRSGPWIRAERQTILRLPRSRWVVFAIHTYVLRALEDA